LAVAAIASQVRAKGSIRHSMLWPITAIAAVGGSGCQTDISGQSTDL